MDRKDLVIYIVLLLGATMVIFGELANEVGFAVSMVLLSVLILFSDKIVKEKK